MATGINPAGMLDPSLPLLQQQAEQAQAYAQALRGQALTPLKTDDMVSGRVVRVSPLQPLAKMLQAYMGARQQDEANTLTGHVAAAQGDAMRRLIDPGYQTPIPGQPSQAGPPAALAGPAPEQPSPASDALGAGAAGGSVGPTNANAATMAGLLRQAPAQQPMQPPVQAPQQGQGTAPMAMPGMTPQQAMSMMLMGGPEEYAKAFAARTDNRTDLTKALMSAGIDPASPQGNAMLRDGIKKANYIAPTSLRWGGYVQNPDGSRDQLPQVPEGSQASRGPDGQWQITPVPGGAAAISMMSGAKAAGTAPYQLVDNFNSATGAPGKQFAGTTPGLSLPGVPSAAPAQPGRPALPPQPGDTPDGVRAQIAMVQSNGGQPIRPEDQSSIDREVQQLKAKLAGMPGGAGAAPAGQSLGVQTGPALGQTANANAAAEGGQKMLDQRWSALQQNASEAQNTRSYLESIRTLASKAGTGQFSDRLQYANSILSLLGSDKATDAVTAKNLLDKFSNQIVARLGQGGLGTDSARAILASAYPNSHMTPAAISEAVENLSGAQGMTQAKAQFLAPVAAKRDVSGYNEAEQNFDRAADPRVWQYEGMTDPAKKRAFLQGAMQQDPTFMQRAQKLHDMGAIK